ncbi:MAG: hypothetical protein WC894_04265 [Patescibacteria group bacterium]
MTTNYTGLKYSKTRRIINVFPSLFSDPYELVRVTGKFTSDPAPRQPEERCFILHPDGIASSIDDYHRRIKSTLCLEDKEEGTKYFAGNRLTVSINGARALQNGLLTEGQIMIIGAEDGADGGTGGDAYMEVEFTPPSYLSRR